MSGETPDLSGGIGGGAGPGGGSAAGGVGAGGAGVGGAGAGAGAGAGGAGGFGGIAGSQLVPILIAGGLSGVIAMSALIALNVVPVHSGGSGASPRGLVLVACPASGPVLAVVDPGQKLLVTGRSSDGAWLQVYLPGPALPYAWAPASELQPSGDTGTLPVASCDVAVASPSATPIVAVVTPSPTPTPRPTPTPTPTATPTNSSPIIENLAASPATIYYSWNSASGPSCGPDAKDPDTATISAKITDPQGVASATLFYRLPTGSFTSKTMTRSGSTYAATVRVSKDFNHTGNLDYYVVSKDGSAAAKTRTSPQRSVAVRKCDLPPRVTDSAISSSQYGFFLYVPLKTQTVGIPMCSTLKPGANQFTITANAIDSDGTIAKLVFWYTPYKGKLQSLSLAHISGGLFRGTLTNAKFAKLATVGPHPFTGYFVATDDAGRTSAHTPPLPGAPLNEQGCSP